MKVEISDTLYDQFGESIDKIFTGLLKMIKRSKASLKKGCNIQELGRISFALKYDESLIEIPKEALKEFDHVELCNLNRESYYMVFSLKFNDHQSENSRKITTNMNLIPELRFSFQYNGDVIPEFLWKDDGDFSSIWFNAARDFEPEYLIEEWKYLCENYYSEAIAKNVLAKFLNTLFFKKGGEIQF